MLTGDEPMLPAAAKPHLRFEPDIGRRGAGGRRHVA